MGEKQQQSPPPPYLSSQPTTGYSQNHTPIGYDPYPPPPQTLNSNNAYANPAGYYSTYNPQV